MADLTNKQQAFILHYLMCWNGTRAALLAGYSPESAASIASENLKKPNIARAIEASLAELKMDADEVLTRLAAQARGTLDDFINESGEIDHAKAREAKKMHLLKKYRKVRRYFKGELSEESVEIELHDAQNALNLIGRHLQLFTERVEHTGKVSVEYVNDWRKDTEP